MEGEGDGGKQQLEQRGTAAGALYLVSRRY